MNQLKIILVALPLFMAMSFQSESCSGKQQTVNTKSQTVNTNTKKVAAQREERMTKGTWGGNQVSMEVTDEGGRIEYVCAHGTISEPLKIDSQGKFSAKGLHFRERGGPIREGSEERGEPVIYSGTTDGKTATLTVTNSQTSEVLGTFTLSHGKAGRVTKCL